MYLAKFRQNVVVQGPLIAGLSGSFRSARFSGPSTPFSGPQTAVAPAFQRGGKGEVFLRVEKRRTIFRKGRMA
jgi:hypothetical protein